MKIKNYICCFYKKATSFNEANTMLFISISPKGFSFGLLIMDKTKDKEKFIQNSQNNFNKEIIFQNTHIDDNYELHPSSSRKGLDHINYLREWLNNILTCKNSVTNYIQASVHLNINQILLFSSEQLSTQIKQTFEGLFVLFLMATCNDPIQETRRYLNFHKTIQVDYSEPSFPDICKKVTAQGLRISESTLRRYHLALKSRKFIILSGISGTGKTWLTKAYAEAVEAEYILVPVAPNWTTNEDLLGYLSPMDNKYHETDFSAFLKKAEEEYQQAQAKQLTPRPYHLVLDEMNLARVEYYFAKFLSAMEVRMREGVAQIQLASEKTSLTSSEPLLYWYS